jgi:putative hydrolase of the HAD superfamily
MQLERVQYLTFDVAGTLIDCETGILEWCQPWLRQHGQRIDNEQILADFAAAEEALQTEYPSMAFTAMLAYVLDRLAAQWAVDADESSLLDFRDSIRDWPAFADTVAGLRTLAGHYRLVAVTNADSWALARMSETLGQPFWAQVTRDEVGTNKPDPAVWRYTLDKLGTTTEHVLHCAQSGYHDLRSAHAFGLATANIERRHGQPGSGATPRSDVEAEPDLHVRDLNGLIEALRPRWS